MATNVFLHKSKLEVVDDMVVNNLWYGRLKNWEVYPFGLSNDYDMEYHTEKRFFMMFILCSPIEKWIICG